MSASTDEPPVLTLPQGQLREWVQVALLMADMVARRRERLGREAWAEERAAERALDRAEREPNMREADDEERAQHLLPGWPWEVGGRAAHRPDALVTTEISQVADRWILHATGHRAEPMGDVHAWLSCPTREHAARVATDLLERGDPDRVERLRDELQFADDREAGPRFRGADEDVHQSRRRNGPRGSGAGNDPSADGARPSADSDGRGRRGETGTGDRSRRTSFDGSAMEAELRTVFDQASAAAICRDPRWSSVAREMRDAQNDGHDVGMLLASVRSRLHQPLSSSYYRSPAAYLFALIRKERDVADRAAAGEHIDMPVAPPETTSTPDPGRAPDARAADEVGDEENTPDGAVPPTGTPRAVDLSEWIAGLDSESDLDRMLAEDTVGRFGHEVDQALGEKFPGLLSSHRHTDPTPDLEAHEVREPEGQLGEPDPHEAAAGRAAALDAEGLDDGAVVRASVSATPCRAAAARGLQTRPAPGSNPARSPSPGPTRTPGSPGRRAPRR